MCTLPLICNISETIHRPDHIDLLTTYPNNYYSLLLSTNANIYCSGVNVSTKYCGLLRIAHNISFAEMKLNVKRHSLQYSKLLVHIVIVQTVRPQSLKYFKYKLSKV